VHAVVPGEELPPEAPAVVQPAAVQPAAVLPTADSGQPQRSTDDPEKKTDQRDPFRPFTLDLRPPENTEPLTPLQTYDLRQLTVAAVMWDFTPPLAMLEDELGMGFIVSPGTLIGRLGGVVTGIQPGRVIVEEKMVDFYGHEQVNRVVLEMPREGEPTAGREKR
jgi:hypothetical protein